MADIESEVRDFVGTITLNRPERKNAFTMAMVNQWADLLESFRDDDAVRVIVVRGSGGSFCSGVDLDEFSAEIRTPLGEKELLQLNVHRVARALETIDKPVIASVDGVAVGAGMDMALLCDLRFASPKARFSEGYIKVGLVPGDGGAWLLPRIVGRSTALRLLWSGEFVSASEAARLGLVEEVIEDQFVDDFVSKYARGLAQRSPFAVRAIKRAVRQGANHDLLTALDLISSHMAIVRSLDDSREALDAVRERREPKFTGK